MNNDQTFESILLSALRSKKRVFIRTKSGGELSVTIRDIDKNLVTAISTGTTPKNVFFELSSIEVISSSM